MFSTPDSQEYLNVSNEIFNFSVTELSDKRPFLYPLLIMLSYKPMGVFGLWGLQFLFWLVSINLIYLSVKRITGNRKISLTASLIIALNLSYLALTLHGLTEVTTIFLLSLLIFFISFNIDKKHTLFFLHVCLLLVSLLTVVKPLFFIPAILVLFVILPIFYLKQYISRPQYLTWLVISIAPLFFQMTIMKAKHGSFSISNIGSTTFRAYILTQGLYKNNYSVLNKPSYYEVQKKALNLSSMEAASYILKNKTIFLNLYFNNIKENINASPTFLLFPKDFGHELFARYMKNVNRIYYYFHILFFLPVVLSIFSVLRRKETEWLVLMVFSSFLTYYILLSSGISFWQGDRLVISSLPIWIFLYSLVLKYIFDKEKKCIMAGYCNCRK